MVNLRNLNQIAIMDVYPLSLQLNIIASIAGCKYINVMDGTDFFYQWRVAEKDKEKFTIINYQELETLKVIIMGYKGSPFYT